MGEKISTVILKIDLNCNRCYKKISKTICKLQERANIQTITFDEKNNSVTISGPFDPHKLCKKLCCKASDVIRDIQIKQQSNEKPIEPTQPKKGKAEDVKPTEPVEPMKDKPKDIKQSEPIEPKKDDTKPVELDEPKKDKPKDDAKPSEPKKDKPKDPEPNKGEPEALETDPFKTDPVHVGQEPKFVHEPVLVDQGPKFIYEPVWIEPGCGCGCRNEEYYGENRCWWCGRRYSWMPEVPPSIQPPVVYGAPVYGGYKTCNFFSEEEPQSCRIM